MFSSVRTSADFNSFNNNNNGPLSKMRTGVGVGGGVGARKNEPQGSPPVVNAVPKEVKQEKAASAIRGEWFKWVETPLKSFVRN